MKIALLSDIHLVAENPIARLDDIVVTEFGKLSAVFMYCIEHNIDVILQAGDLVDIKRSWELLPRLTTFLNSYRGIQLYLVRGQHDSYYHSMTNEKTIVGVLVASGLVNLLGEIGHSIGTPGAVYVYGASWGEPVPKPTTKGLNILVVHKQILMNKIWKKQSEFDYAPEFLITHKEYDLILCGDHHRKFYFKNGKRIICNTGPMMRLEANKDMMEHTPGFFVYDTNKGSCEWITIPSLPSTVVLSTKHLDAKHQMEKSFEEFTTKIQEAAEGKKTLSFDRNLRLMIHRLKTKDSVRKIISEVQGEI